MGTQLEVPANKTLVTSMTWVTSSDLLQEGETKSFNVKGHDGIVSKVVLTREGNAVIAQLSSPFGGTLEVAEGETEIYVKF